MVTDLVILSVLLVVASGVVGYHNGPYCLCSSVAMKLSHSITR